MLSRSEARAFYDRFGSKQDAQWFYEDRATADLVAYASFPTAEAVFEFGCGTGRFAQGLFERHLNGSATYLGVDISATMVELARRRLAPFGARAVVQQSDGGPPVDVPSAAFDRVVSNFVLDLLTDDDVRAVVREAHRILRPAGLLCLVSLAEGDGLVSRGMARLWQTVHALRPALVGGCRPIAIRPFLAGGDWGIRHTRAMAPFGVPSEVVVASKIPRPDAKRP